MKAIERAVVGVLALGVLIATGCNERHSSKEVYYLIAANVNLPYGKRRRRGSNRLRPSSR